jgi:amino acid adenylation domain-containing protein
VSYGELARISDRVRDQLMALGVGRGDRVGLCLRKSIDTVAAILGVLKSGAAYVPVDPNAPASRNGAILEDCSVAAVFVEDRIRPKLDAELGGGARRLELPHPGGGRGLEAWLEEAPAVPMARTAEARSGDLAYILYTSGSTGKPKGVMLSHGNAVSFVEWAAESFEPVPQDRFSSHAPFHFDLSILDLYLPQRTGATLVLISEEQGREPLGLAQLIAESRISIWYSAPSILSMLAQRGKLEGHDFTALRTILFAGEVFPLVHLRSLHAQLPKPRYFNLYGPTETNVCTFYELPPVIPSERSDPFPIGRVCSNLRGIVVASDGGEVEAGEEGELCISGAGVMQGYWNRPESTAEAFLERDGVRWYRTGDVVAEEADGNLCFRGRRDRMVKRRGYRVELGEIEACLYRHPEVSEVAVVAHPDEEAGVRIVAHVATRSGERLSLIKVKRFCSEHLPVYMVPDVVRTHPELPKTSTDKLDYQKLRELV